MEDFKKNFNLKDWKVHVLCLVIMVIAELIGTMKITVNGARGNGISFSLIPMLFAIVIGIAHGGMKKIKKETTLEEQEKQARAWEKRKFGKKTGRVRVRNEAYV